MLNIIHLTDFHLNKRNLKDWKDFVKEPLITRLIEIDNEVKIDLIVFTGDMIDKGGKDFDNPQIAFQEFQENVINPIISNLKLGIDRFLIVPGNHDIQRDKDSEREELGNKAYFTSIDIVNSYINEEGKSLKFSGMKRIEEFKKFEKELYTSLNDNNYKHSIFGSAHIVSINGEDVGICCLNSAWRCWDNNDNGQILIGETQLVDNHKFISKCKIKIALLHHPLDTISEIEKKNISSFLQREFDLLLLGHSHETITTISTSFLGSLFVNLAPSGSNDIRTDSRSFANGFTSILLDENKIICSYFKYNHHKKRFIPNAEVSQNDDGKSIYYYPSKVDNKEDLLTAEFVIKIKENHYDFMNDFHIGARAKIDKSSLIESYILPPINDGTSKSDEKDGNDIYSLNQITSSKSNLMFHGAEESGKTVLLYRLVIEYIEQFEFLQRIPVYLDFEEIRNKEIITVIKEYLGGKSEEIKLLLESKKIVLLVDNLNYEKFDANPHPFRKLHKFVTEYQEIRIISCTNNELSGIIQNEYLAHCKILFNNYFIKPLTSSKIKDVMALWIPKESKDEIEMNTNLDNLVNNFCSYSLPSTAMSVSLFLWTTEYSERKPLNNAVLLEIYIEIILEKLNINNIYRGTFDFTNKMQLLAKVAHEMLLNGDENYCLKYSAFCKTVETYLEKEVGFSQNPSVIIEYLFDRKIINRNRSNFVKFSKSCFFHFFLAKRMQYDIGFKNKVLSEDQYFKYGKEIEYYCGLTRSDKTCLELIYSYSKKEFDKFDNLLSTLDIDIDEYFTSKSNDIGSLIENVDINDISNNRPSEKMLETIQDKKLSGIDDPYKIVKKENKSGILNYLVIMCNVLRNSEGIEDLQLKKDIYNSIIKWSVSFCILHREALIHFIVDHDRLPLSFPKEIDLLRYIENVPLTLQGGLRGFLATPKLEIVILEKIKQDRKMSNSNIESFFSVFLYSDIKGYEFDKEIKRFILLLKTRRTCNVATNYSLLKLLQYYYERTRPNSINEKLYLDLIISLKIKSQKYPKSLKDKLRKKLKAGKDKFSSK